MTRKQKNINLKGLMETYDPKKDDTREFPLKFEFIIHSGCAGLR